MPDTVSKNYRVKQDTQVKTQDMNNYERGKRKLKETHKINLQKDKENHR